MNRLITLATVPSLNSGAGEVVSLVERVGNFLQFPKLISFPNFIHHFHISSCLNSFLHLRPIYRYSYFPFINFFKALVVNNFTLDKQTKYFTQEEIGYVL